MESCALFSRKSVLLLAEKYCPAIAVTVKNMTGGGFNLFQKRERKETAMDKRERKETAMDKY